MKVLLTGAGGQLGRDLRRTVPSFVRLLPFERDALDISDAWAVTALLDEERPDLLINAAAYTAVDRAENEREQAWAVNADGVANLGRAAARAGTRMLHVSTDFVFAGEQSSPYLPTDCPHPLSVYGASKLAGEQELLAISRGEALIMRTGWLYAAGGRNFVSTILRLLSEREEVRVVADQIGTPTWTRSLAEALWAAAARPTLRGIYHWSDAGVASWYDFAVAIQEEALRLGLLRRAVAICPIATADYPTPARRPPYSVLDKSASWRDLAQPARHWRVCLREMLEELKTDE